MHVEARALRGPSFGTGQGRRKTRYNVGVSGLTVWTQRGNRSHREPSQEKAQACSLQHRCSIASATATNDLAVLVLQQGDGERVVDVLALRRHEGELVMCEIDDL